MALNVALYGADGRRWTMTERGERSLRREPSRLAIGPSAMAWDGRALSIDIEERGAPWPTRVAGRVRVEPVGVHGTSHALDADAAHTWTPIAPLARVTVEFTHPASRWSGHGYFDCNAGARPLERDFVRWHWSRRSDPDGAATILYDVERRDGTHRSIALSAPADGGAPTACVPPGRAPLSRTRWGVARTTRCDAGSTPTVVRTLEDGPFYARSVVRSTLGGVAAEAVHESLDLDRFTTPWVQAMLPFRVPRRA